MAGITLEQAQAQLDAALAGRASLTGVQETQVSGTTGGRKTIYRTLADANADVLFWDRKVKELSRVGIQTFLAVPRG